MTTYVAVDKGGREYVYDTKPFRDSLNRQWILIRGASIPLPKGSIQLLIGYRLTWKDEPVKLDSIKTILNSVNKQ